MVWNLEEQYLKVRNKSTFQLLEKQCVETDVGSWRQEQFVGFYPVLVSLEKATEKEAATRSAVPLW